MARSRLISNVSEGGSNGGRVNRRGGLTFIHLDVDRAPPDIILGGLFVNDTFVFGRTTGFFARKVDEGARGGDDSTFVADGFLIEERDGSITLYLDTIHLEACLRKVFEITANDWGEMRNSNGEQEGYVRFECDSTSADWA